MDIVCLCFYVSVCEYLGRRGGGGEMYFMKKSCFAAAACPFNQELWGCTAD